MSQTPVSPTQKLAVACEGPVATLKIDNPARRNAIDLSMWQALPDLVAALDSRPETRVIVLTGAAGTFTAGADISEFAETRMGAGPARAYEAANGAAFAAIRSTTNPVVASIPRFCMGGGLAIALAADIRIAADDAEFAVPPARLGLGYPVDGLADLVGAVGAPNARDLLFSARRIGAEEALALGLVNRVVAADRLEAETRAFVETIAENAPLTLRAAKQAIAAISAGRLEADRADIDALVDACFASADYAEGCTAFLEKRKPVFQGR